MAKTSENTNSDAWIGPMLQAGLEHHRAGRLKQAEASYREVLVLAPDNGDAHNLMCGLMLQSGDSAQAIEHGRAAVQAQPDAAAFWNTLGAALRRGGDISASIEAFTNALTHDPKQPDARRNLAGTLAQAGQFEAAEKAYRGVLMDTPQDARVLVQLGNVLIASGDKNGAIGAWQNAVEVEPMLADGWINLVGGHSDSGAYDAAEQAYRDALGHGISDAGLHVNMARAELARGAMSAAQRLAETGLSIDSGHAASAVVLALTRLELGDAAGAEALARQVTAAAPGLAEAWSTLAAALERLRRPEDAIEAYEQALQVSPGDVDAGVNLADLYERTNALDRAQALVDRVLEVAPDHVSTNRIAATLARRRGDTAGGIERLMPLADRAAPPRVQQGMHFELGRLLDRDNDAAGAFHHFAEGNRIQSEGAGSRRFDPGVYREELSHSAQALTPAWIKSWQDVVATSDQAPVFLVGFPRSGTTLLDQILDSHPGIQVVEEKPMVEVLKRDIAARADGYPQALAGLTEADIVELRRSYWAHADEFVTRDPGVIFVDKFPLNIEKAVLIHLVFPDAKFILALRHPADCVPSCFMQSFRPNIAMNNFHTVEGAARIYDIVFGLWSRANELLPLEVHQIRYEDLVSDIWPHVEELLGFLGLGWDDGVLDYAENARYRGQINTPSYNQVTEPIYTRARGRWVRYREQMGAALDILEPWIERFDYKD